MMRLSSKNDDSSLCYDVIIKHNFKIDKFGDFSREIGFNTKMDIFRDVISLIINQCHLQATEGSLRRTQSVRQPRSASKRSALVVNRNKMIRDRNKHLFYKVFRIDDSQIYVI